MVLTNFNGAGVGFGFGVGCGFGIGWGFGGKSLHTLGLGVGKHQSPQIQPFQPTVTKLYGQMNVDMLLKQLPMIECFQGGGCGIGLGLGWGFGTAYGTHYVDSKITFQGIDFEKVKTLENKPEDLAKQSQDQAG